MEETIGYEALFAAEEWSELDLIEDEEMELAFSNTAPDGETVEGPHTCTIYGPEERVGEFEIECDRCGVIGRADDRETAGLLKRFHDSAFELASKAVGS